MSAIIIKGNIDENKKREVQDIEKKRLFNAHKHCGIIKWKKDPVKYQKELRDEWEHPD
ncbi:MAG: hypothetical protein HY607_07860 [Planctomycetes bacterium]|uniref:hypothetical protein n=1 Tax=Candidatus Wunengus californicus TaxID=3367619 RepID=UPI004025D3BC|nr:hypothetical protein [Planctomycetota bacterium]